MLLIFKNKTIMALVIAQINNTGLISVFHNSHLWDYGHMYQSYKTMILKLIQYCTNSDHFTLIRPGLASVKYSV